MTHAQDDQQPAKRWTAGRIAKWVGIAFGAMLVLGMIGAALNPQPVEPTRPEPSAAAPEPSQVDEASAPTSAPATAAAPTARPRATAREVVTAMEQLYPIPNQRDNTGSCAPACSQLITTDSVSVYEWREEDDARRFAEGTDQSRAGRFVLAYGNELQRATSDEARAAWLRLVRSRYAGR